MGTQLFIHTDSPAALFRLEGGRLAAIQRPTGEELCLKRGRNSSWSSNFQVQGRVVATGTPMADAGSYVFRSGSNALGGTG